MTDSLVGIYKEIARVADEKGKSEVALRAHACADPQRPLDILVLSWQQAGAMSLCDWIKREVSRCHVSIAEARELADSPCRVHAADRVLAMLPFGEFLDAEQFGQLQDFVLTRPRGTFRLILAADQTPDMDALARYESGLRGLLAPGRMGGPVIAEQGQEDFILWTKQTAVVELTNRIEQDCAALLTWLQQPLATRTENELFQFKALDLLQLLEQQEVPAGTPSASPDQQQLAKLADQVRQCRRRLMDVMERGVSGVKRELSTSLNTLECDLLHDMRGPLKDRLGNGAAHLTGDRLRATVGEFVRCKLVDWSNSARATVAKRSEELAKDVEVLVQGNNWRSLNEVVVQQGRKEHYPEDLLNALRFSAESVQDMMSLPEDVVLPDGWQRTSGGGLPQGSTPWLGAICGGAVAAASALWLLPLGPLGALLGGSIGALGGAYAGRKMMDPPAVDHAMRQVEQAIVQTAQRSLEAVNRFTREVATHQREQVKKQFEEIEMVLTKQASHSGAPTHEATADSNAAQLARLREQVLSTASSG